MKTPRRKKEVIKLPMVGWYHPCQLARTGLEVIISSVLGRHADKRILEAIADNGDLRTRYIYEVEGRDSGDFWFDYISDVGDGFNSTYTMAYHLSAKTLEVSEREKDSISEETRRGELLIFGGDEVYPVGGHEEYKQRLTDPYSAAFPELSKTAKEKPDNKIQPIAFAIPGNHDWYDSLVAFSKTFCSKKPFCGWNTVQNRSYFAIKLPHGWWLFGTDMQLASALDDAQIEYFKKVMECVADDDHIILCNAEPYWITEKMYENDPKYTNRNLGYFVGGVLKRKVAIYLAGDRHYYRHHEIARSGKKDIHEDNKSKMHKIVAGGGGAFLHPTHNEKVEEIGKSDIYALRKTYPDEQTSRSLSFRNLLFPIWNWQFSIVTGLLYLLTAQAFFASIGAFKPGFGKQTFTDVFTTFLSQPIAFYWVILILVSFIFFTDAHSKVYKWIAGPIHALSHLFAVLMIGWVTSAVAFGSIEAADSSIWRVLLAGFAILLSGGIVGSFIMGLYLLISLNVFGVHHNEAFSALKIEDYKNFLRLKISETGDLTIFPIGVERVNKNWTSYDRSIVPHIEPVEPCKIDKPFLIESPIKYAKLHKPRDGEVKQSGLFTIKEREFKNI